MGGVLGGVGGAAGGFLSKIGDDIADAAAAGFQQGVAEVVSGGSLAARSGGVASAATTAKMANAPSVLAEVVEAQAGGTLAIPKQPQGTLAAKGEFPIHSGADFLPQSNVAKAVIRGAPELGGFAHGIGADEISAINRSLGGSTLMTGHPSSALSAATRHSGFYEKSAATIREIAGRHMFDNGNKRTANAVYDLLRRRNEISTGVPQSEVRRIINSVATGEMSEVSEIATALRGF